MSRILTATLSLLLMMAFGGVSFADNAAQEAKLKVKNLAKGAKTVKLADRALEGAEEVDLFQAIADDQIEVGVIQGAMKGGKVFVKNKTDKPLSVRMPKAFGTRPIMGQDMGGGQLMGGGGMNGGGGGMNGGMGGFQNVPAEAVTAVKYQSVCLEYGKPEPNANMAYEICPINEVTNKAEVVFVVENLGSTDLRSAQFAAWHLSSGTPIEKLASETVLHANGVTTTNFSKQEVLQGIQLIKMAKAAAETVAPAESSSATSSSEF